MLKYEIQIVIIDYLKQIDSIIETIDNLTMLDDSDYLDEYVLSQTDEVQVVIREIIKKINLDLPN